MVCDIICDIICDILCDMRKCCFITPALRALWLQPPCCVSLSPPPWTLPHSLDSLHLLNGHRQGLASSVAPQPEIQLVDSAAVPVIRLGIGRHCTKESAVLEFEGNSWMGVAGYEAGERRQNNNNILHTQKEYYTSYHT